MHRERERVLLGSPCQSFKKKQRGSTCICSMFNEMLRMKQETNNSTKKNTPTHSKRERVPVYVQWNAENEARNKQLNCHPAQKVL